jgi:hypothetical protein
MGAGAECRSIGPREQPWQRAREVAGLTGLRYHNLRHSAAWKRLGDGILNATVAQVIGEFASTALRVANRRGHVRPDARRQVLRSKPRVCQVEKLLAYRGLRVQLVTNCPKAIQLSPFRPVAQSG